MIFHVDVQNLSGDATLFVEQCLNNVVIKVHCNTCLIDNVDEYCSINSCSILTKTNSCYNVVGTRADNS